MGFFRNRRAVELILTAVALGIAVAPLPRAAVERVYARGLYPLIQPTLTRFSNLVPIALFDLLLIAALAVVIGLWLAGFRAAPEPGRWRAVPGLLLDSCAIAALVYVWFLLAWGLNYQRVPLRSQLDVSAERVTPAALHDLAIRDVDEMNRLYETAHAQSWPELAAMTPMLDGPFAQSQRDLGMNWQARAGRPKRSVLDFYFRRVAVDGFTDPFFLETLANQGLLPFERPFVVAHEWSHLAGYADESEANFVAWLMCLRGGPQARYSAWISLYWTIAAALPPQERQPIADRLGDGPRRDLAAMSDRLARQVNRRASRAGYAVYDRFLKANRVEAGIRSYSEVIQLLLGARFNPDGSPVLR